MIRTSPTGTPRRSSPRGGGWTPSSNYYSSTTVALLIMATSIPSFFLGTLVSLYAGLEKTTQSAMDGFPNLDSQRVRGAAEAVPQECPDASSTSQLFPSDLFGNYVIDMGSVPKADFVHFVDPGVPLDPPRPGSENVLLLYAHEKAKPNTATMRMPEAVENCHQLNVILADHSGHNQQCFAIVPQYESYHIQKWMRVDLESHKLDATQPLQHVARGLVARSGRNAFRPPPLSDTRQHWSFLQSYFENLSTVLEEVDSILKRIAKNNTVIVMVCNFGQSELLMNFVCSARSRGFDLSNVVVFTTDQETTDLADGLGLATYYDKRNFGDVPLEAASQYGDKKFVAMMMAKVVCVQLVSTLGYDFLFQDVDVVWYKDPLEYFSQPAVSEFDVYFQDDGGHSVRYAPYSANSGFYFVRANDRTRHFLSQLLVAGDLILSTKSHQQALIATLNDHVSLFGLKAKVLSRDMEEFPGGYQYNAKNRQYMKDFFAGKLHPYIFHMSWTLNKENKLLYLKQMGEWFVQEQCVAKTQQDILAGASASDTSLQAACCAAEPLISCHYRDKPSKLPCRESPPIDKGMSSFW